ncbi:hypothetical protein F511_27260 [Dorcoceras hygrometricum]|uniref:Pollen Ole e 1 allergen and extensin family protein n=1 Tax=Dorcoceras hygrometricum TaxID=472368 RepID=A0A2Z7CGE8_9LAMI|nr:hypothetical protein F511_27260 [Dorcoceras hygrometricum]
MFFSAFVLFICLFETPVTSAGRTSPEVDELLVNWAGYGEEKLSTVVITGNLLCHENTAANSKTSGHPNPVSGASVAVFCGTSGRKVKKSTAKGRTDGYGEFQIDLPSHLHAIPNLEKACLVKVIHLPKDSPCRQASTGKHKGIKLISIGEDSRTYTTHNIHLTSKASQGQPRRGENNESYINVGA